MKIKNQKAYVIISFILVVEVICGFLTYKMVSNKKVKLDNVVLINNKQEENTGQMFAFMLETSKDSNKYNQSEENTWPGKGYSFNQTKSGCMDSEGRKIDGELNYIEESNTVTLKSATTVFCYLYFDNEDDLPVVDKIEKSASTDTTLTVKVTAHDDNFKITEYYYKIEDKATSIALTSTLETNDFEKDTSNTHIFSNVSKGKSYNVSVYVKDEKGNQSDTLTQEVRMTPAALETLKGKSDSGLSEILVGGMYRYQGTDVNNYICLKEVGQANCEDKSENMYRIIGITPEGNIKVIKQTKYNKGGTTTFKWNTNYHDNSSSSSGYCEKNGCPEWPESDIYKELNTNNDSFLSKLASDIQNKIEDWEWYYGDIAYDYANKTAEEIYKIEIGQANTQYYGKTSSNTNLVTDQKWQKMNKTAKIGLIYLHDYYYQSTSNNCHYNNNTYTQCKEGGWMHISKNNSSLSGNEQYEWTMSRIGRHSSSGPYFFAWSVISSGNVNHNYLNATFAVRPVFYLKSNVELEGEGTTKSPFYIKS